MFEIVVQLGRSIFTDQHDTGHIGLVPAMVNNIMTLTQILPTYRPVVLPTVCTIEASLDLESASG